MRIKPLVIYQWARTHQTTQGYIIRIKMKLQSLPKINKKEFPQDYKFNWIAYNVENANQRVLFDNHHGKPPHYHIDKDKKGIPFAWLSQEKSESLFWEQVNQRFGSLKKYAL